MSSRLIRGDERIQKFKVRTVDGEAERVSDIESQERMNRLEKDAFAQGYGEGERIGKQMGQRMVESAIKRYEHTVAELATAHTAVVASMQRQTVELALEIARKIIQREIAIDQEIVTALAIVALGRVQSHAAITLRVCREDYRRVREAIGSVNGSISVTEDSSLDRGDFVIDTS